MYRSNTDTHYSMDSQTHINQNGEMKNMNKKILGTIILVLFGLLLISGCKTCNKVCEKSEQVCTDMRQVCDEKNWLGNCIAFKNVCYSYESQCTSYVDVCKYGVD